MVQDVVRLESRNLPLMYIRHHNFEGELNELRHPASEPKDDFKWIVEYEDEKVDGLEVVRLLSVNVPNHYLRHQNYRILLHKAPEPSEVDQRNLFRLDSRFRKKPGLAGMTAEDYWSFEAMNPNLDNHYIAHIDFHLFIREYQDSDLFKQDATFKMVKLSPEEIQRPGL